MPPTILNVDDTEIARYAKRRTLVHAGFEVLDASTGAEALLTLERETVPLVLLDVNLPDINGIEVCRAIKSRWPNTLVLQTSAAFTSSADRTRGLEGGADGYLNQPIDAHELVASVRALLRLYAAEETTRKLNESLESRIAERTRDLQKANMHLQEQIAQRAQAEAALMQAQKMELMGEFTGTMAHDFNNILGAITNYLHLAGRISGEERVKDYLDKALATSDRGRQLTERLLAFVRHSDLTAQRVPVGALVLAMQDWLNQSAGDNIQVSLEVQSEGENDSLVVMTDSNQLELAILNLVINARDAMPDGGAIQVKVEGATLAHPLDDLEPGRYVVVSVSDDGTGMPPEVMSRAVEAFFTTKPAGRGTGLGLAQVNNLARLSKGAVKLSSVVGQGSTVAIWMPHAPH